MARIPKRPQDIFAAFTADFQKALKEDLISITLFGSGARGEYLPGKSDINFLIVTSDPAMGRLQEVLELMSKWRKRKVATPLIMTRKELCCSIDSFPVEFINMKRHYRVIFGEDLLAGLEFKSEHVRLQCERELRGKSLLLAQRYLETNGSPRKLRALIADSITAFVSIFNALLFLKGVHVPDNKREVVRETALQYGLDLDVFLKCIDVKEGILAFSKSDIRNVFQAYLKEARKMIDVIDIMQCR